MAQSDFLEKTDDPLAVQMEHFRDNVGPFVILFGLNPTEVGGQAVDATVFRFVLTQQKRIIAAGQQSTDAKNKLRDGDPSAPNVAISLAFPAQPAIVPSPVFPGVVKRFRDLVAKIKAHANYTRAIGETLKIEGAELVGPDTVDGQPDLTGAKVAGGQVIIPWAKGKYQGIRIEKDRGDGTGFHFIAVDTSPDYIDTEPHPTTPTIWKYRAFYIVDDQKVGQCSAVVEVRVGG